MNRSDFFMVMVNVGFMYVVASSCGLEDKVKTPAESEILHGNRQRCTKQSSSCIPFDRLSIGLM
ncbi:hypothetical protein ACLHDF_18780 [Priestia aryabhattai]|uniref:hypothetical protein n=1 Tax=Priestia megaterium TaxID=1404 RepID=UPI0039B8985B